MMKSIKFLLFSLIAGTVFIACQKDTLVTNVPHNEEPDLNWGKGDSIPLVTDFYFHGKIDSVMYTLQDSINGSYNLVFDSTYLDCLDSSNFYGQITGMYSLGNAYSLEVKFLKCIGDTANMTDKTSLLYAGAYPYGSSEPLNQIDGVEISWIDATGKVWKSLPGSGAVTDNSFVVQLISPNPGLGLGEKLILGTMDLRLYNGVESIRVEGGVFSFQYGVY